MGSARRNAAVCPRAGASAQRCAEPTLRRGNSDGGHAAAIRLSGRPPVHSDQRRSPGGPARRHDRRHRARASDGRYAAHAGSGECARPGRQRDRQPRHGDADRLLAAPVVGRRATCAALAAAVQAKPNVKGTVVAAFTVRSLYATKAGFQSLVKLQGPFAEVKEPSLTARYADTPVETVALKDADALAQRLIAWMEGR